MNRGAALSLMVALVVASPALAKRTKAAPKAAAISVISAGNEQALSLGKTVISRPFGAQLVDTLNVAGSYRTKAGTYHLVRGEATGECPARYLVVYQQGSEAPVASEPFGTCAKGAIGAVTRTGFVVTMPATAAGGPSVRFRYEDGKMRLVDAMPAATVASVDGRLGFAARQASTCRTPTSADPATQASVVADFSRSYPAEYKTSKLLKRTAIAPDELRATVTGLACLSRWPGAEQVVPEAATPLFASKRYGPAAFEMIQTIARDANSDVNLRAAVRAFGAEMIYRVDRREPL
jgi:hypothetical protein